MKRPLIISGWLASCLLTLLMSFTTLHFLKKAQYVELDNLVAASNSTQKAPILAYKTPNTQVKGMTTKALVQDSRPALISRYLKHYNAPLTPYDYWGQFLTNLADKYEMDHRLLPAIAMQESGLCKVIPENSFNCLGLGVHSQGTWHFDSYEANFEAAAKILKKNYIDEGLVTPLEIQSKYTPASNGSWANAIEHFMDQLTTGEF